MTIDIDLRDRILWTRVLITKEGCFDWTGGKNDKAGYGTVNRNGKKWVLPRYVWTIVNGPIPEGLSVLHKCDRPPCINPSHLFLGTHKDNMADMVAKGRVKRGQSSARSKITEHDVRAIREAYPDINSTQLGARYGISSRHVLSIYYRRKGAWDWLP